VSAEFVVLRSGARAGRPCCVGKGGGGGDHAAAEFAAATGGAGTSSAGAFATVRPRVLAIERSGRLTEIPRKLPIKADM
jgi:hypothetical protein